MKDKDKIDISKGRTKEWDYYNRPSINSSYQIAVISIVVLILLIIGMGVLKMIEKVSTKENDFDYTSILLPYEMYVDTLVKRENQLDSTSVDTKVYLNELTCITSP